MIKDFIIGHHGQPLLLLGSTPNNSNRIQKMKLEKQRVENMLQSTKLSLSEKQAILTKALEKDVEDLYNYYLFCFSSFLKRHGVSLRPFEISLAVENLKWLIAKGADIHFRYTNQDTLLIKYAGKTDESAVRTVEVLIQLGSDLIATNNIGNTALKWAKHMRGSNDGMISLLESATNDYVSKVSEVSEMPKESKCSIS